MESNDDLPPVKRRVVKSAGFILLSVMFKRYSTATISAILLLFLHLKLGYDEDVSTAIHHSYAFLSSSLVIVGAIMADTWFGIYETQVVMSMVFALGSFIISVSVIDALHLPMHVLSVIGLVILTISDGCQKSLDRTYGASQYHPTEEKSIARFFNLYYFMYNCGSILSRFVSPILRQDVQCFGNNDCFTLAFGLPGIFMIFVTLLTFLANRYSETTQTKGSSLLKVFACIWYAITKKIKLTSTSDEISTKDHWVEYSEEKYGKVLVWETRILLDVGVLYIPITLFWALFYQQESRWVFQAVRMNGDLGFYTILPDQFNVINPLLVLLLMLALEKVIDPLLERVRIKKDLQKVTLGGVLAGLAFIISAIVELQIKEHEDLHMTWLLPQYTLMAMAEVLVTVPMMNFSYTIAPSSMKTMLQAFNNLAIGFGNLFVVIVVGSNLFDSQVFEFILFAALMFVDMVVFAFLAKRFKRVEFVE